MKELSIFVDESGDLSKSEKLIFHSKKALKKDFLKSIHKKQL